MSRLVAGLLLGLVCTADPTAAQVTIAGVSATAPALGEIEVTVGVHADEAVAWVELRIDGHPLGRLAGPPYRFQVDAGERGDAHLFEAVARLVSGAELSARVRTPRLVIHDRVDADLQQLYATVTDRQGKRVVGLGAADFEILDDGVPQRIVTLESGEIPFTAVLLVDGSTSMRGSKIDAARAGVRAFVGGMQPLDEAAVMVFSDRLLASSPPSSDPAALEKALAEVETSGGTAVFDFLYLALSALEQQQGRRVAVVLSDGDDIHSVLRMQQLRAVARRSQAQLFWIQFGQSTRATPEMLESLPPRDLAKVRNYYNSWRDTGEMIRELRQLERVVEESGGRAFGVSRPEDVERAFREILAELREQVAIGYYPTADRDDGSWHEVEVEVVRPGLRVRTRKGYLDY